MKEIISKSQYDVAIIGAGIAGMTSAALLSKAGLSVIVLEKEPHAGGYLAGFRRKEFRFDSAIHWLNQCGAKGLVTRIFQFIGDDFPHTPNMKRIHREKGKHHDFTITSSPEVLKAAWIKAYPEDKKGIEQFFEAAKRMGDAFAEMSPKFRSLETMNLFEKMLSGIGKLKFLRTVIRYVWYGDEKMEKGLDLFFKNPDLRSLFASEKDILSCLFPIAFAYHQDYQLPPKGGSQVFIEWLVHVVEYFKNDIIYNSTVQKIIYEKGKAQGLVFKHKGIEHTVKAQHTIAACDVEMLYEKMLPAHAIPQALKTNLKNAVLYTSAVAISLALDCPTEDLGFKEELVFIKEEGIPREDHYASDPNITAISIIPPSLRDKSLAPKGKGTLTIYTSCEIDYQNYWGTTKDKEGNYIRTEAYYQLKEAYTNIILNRIEQRLGIDLRSHILFKDVATPITHWRYTNNRGGSIMGARPGEANYKAKVAHAQTPVKNLILGGHWADLDGGVPIATRAGANAALLVLKEQNLAAFRTFARYADGKINLPQVKKTGTFQEYNNSWIPTPTPAQQKQKKQATKMVG